MRRGERSNTSDLNHHSRFDYRCLDKRSQPTENDRLREQNKELREKLKKERQHENRK